MSWPWIFRLSAAADDVEVKEVNPKLDESTAETEIDDVWCSPSTPRSKKYAKRGIADEHDHFADTSPERHKSWWRADPPTVDRFGTAQVLAKSHLIWIHPNLSGSAFEHRRGEALLQL